MSPKWPILCWVGHKTLTQWISFAICVLEFPFCFVIVAYLAIQSSAGSVCVSVKFLFWKISCLQILWYQPGVYVFFQLLSSCQIKYIITFCVRHSWGAIVSDIAIFVLKRDVKLQLTNQLRCYVYWSQPSVCLFCVCVCLSLATFLHYCTDLDVTWGKCRGCPLVVHYWADLQSVHGFRCYDNIHV